MLAGACSSANDHASHTYDVDRGQIVRRVSVLYEYANAELLRCSLASIPGLCTDVATAMDGFSSNTVQADRQALLRQHGLMDIRQAIPDAIIDLKYATADNFTGQAIYSVDVCLISRATGTKLVLAAEELRTGGFRLKIFDAYRPSSCQQALYDAAPDKRFVANPDGKGSNHSRGAAVDMTICDMAGNEIPMPSGFDDLTNKAARSQADMPVAVEEKLRMVEDIMQRNGFKPISHEWWHYDDMDAKSMPLLDMPLEMFI